MFESTLPRRIESADAVAFRDFFQGTKKVDFFFSLLGGGIVLFCARDPRFDWRRAVRRVLTLSLRFNENTIDQWETRSSSFKSGDCSGTLVCETSLFYGSQRRDHWPIRLRRRLKGGAKKRDRAARRIRVNQPIKIRQSHCRWESSQRLLVISHAAPRLPGRIQSELLVAESETVLPMRG